MRRPGVTALAAVYAVALLLVVLSPISHALNRLTVRLYVAWNLQLHLPGTPSPEDFGTLLNVLLFVPLGVLVVVVLRWPWWAAALAAVSVSAAVELVQALPALHRDASLADVLANSLGGLLGAVAVAARRRRPPGRTTGRVTAPATRRLP